MSSISSLSVIYPPPTHTHTHTHTSLPQPFVSQPLSPLNRLHASFQLQASAARDANVISSRNETCKCAAAFPYPQWAPIGVYFIRPGWVEQQKIKVEHFPGFLFVGRASLPPPSITKTQFGYCLLTKYAKCVCLCVCVCVCVLQRKSLPVSFAQDKTVHFILILRGGCCSCAKQRKATVRLTFFLLCEISWEALNGLQYNLWQTFMFPTRWMITRFSP